MLLYTSLRRIKIDRTDSLVCTLMYNNFVLVSDFQVDIPKNFLSSQQYFHQLHF